MINVGCTKNFLEYNTNPNEATDEMTDWDNVRTGSLLLQMEQNVLVVVHYFKKLIYVHHYFF